VVPKREQTRKSAKGCGKAQRIYRGYSNGAGKRASEKRGKPAEQEIDEEAQAYQHAKEETSGKKGGRYTKGIPSAVAGWGGEVRSRGGNAQFYCTKMNVG